MADSFRPVFEAMKETAVALVEASQANTRAGEGLKKMLDAAMTAKDEHGDLRETVHRLEGRVMQLSTEIRALRERPENGGS
jgi:hypothetical protein